MSGTGRFSAFKHNSYRLYFGARFCTAFAAQVLSISIAWQMYAETSSMLLLGAIGLVQFLPALGLVFLTGMAADQFGRRLVMGISVVVELACALTILLMAVNRSFDPYAVLFVLLVFGCARAFLAPASSSLAVNLVPKEDFVNAAGFAAVSWQAASIVGPVAGGLLYGISASVAYSVAVGLFLIAAVLVFAIPKPDQVTGQAAKTLSSVLEGFQYVFKEKVVLGAISLDLFAVLLGGAVAMLPVYASDILQVDSQGLGLLRAAPGIGALIMVAIMNIFPIRDHAGIILFVSVALFGLATAVFGASTIAWFSILALMFVGAFDMVSVYIREVLLQLWTPDDVRGRVNAVNSIFLGASNELGEARAGFMGAVLGPVATVVLGGLAAIGIAAGWAFLFPQIRKTRYLERPED
ncbi:MFS transporter [Ponticaulis sp.]|uniref:MFS transporter n=1 Tax=Ponticaulis sp. TaxID=2020902 RepID=UPI000C6A34FC|nr:MFS transporter [Ponticaulis sp.]MAJ08114.1 MFS transporter [Ponticaulis sp.]|tara:strand:+ start:54496 stop:55722 length:1227 start_codon:yes stop_codon:yes gene_type:complete